jgi:hypothetical protein
MKTTTWPAFNSLTSFRQSRLLKKYAPPKLSQALSKMPIIPIRATIIDARIWPLSETMNYRCAHVALCALKRKLLRPRLSDMNPPVGEFSTGELRW